MSAAEATRESGAEVIRHKLRDLANRTVINPSIGLLTALHITPNQITVAGLLGSALAGAVLGWGHLRIGGALVLGGSALDMLDGALARATGKSSKVGALLDSVVDRLAEALILLGLLIYFARLGSLQEIILIFLSFVASVLVSYVKARAEGLGIPCNVGIVTRPERIILLGVGLLVGQVTPFLYILTILSFQTALHRFWHSMREANKQVQAARGA